MAEGTLMDVDNSDERCSFWNQADEISSSKIFNRMARVRQSKKGFHMLVTVCLGVLCVILLAVIISRKSPNCNAGTSDGSIQRLKSDNNATRSTVPPQTSCSHMNKQMDLLLASHNTLIQEKSQLLTRYNNLTDDKNLLQISYTNLMLQKSQLNDKYNSLTTEKVLLQTNVTNLNREKSELQVRNTLLSHEKAQLQASYDNLTREREESPHGKLESRLADGWIARKSSLYKISSEERTWEDSRESCQNMGADLVIVNDLDEQKFIFQYPMAWLGLSDADNEGDWKWVDDTPLTIRFWAPGEPNNSGGEDCAQISSKASLASKSWNDIPCTHTQQYICEDHF